MCIKTQNLNSPIITFLQKKWGEVVGIRLVDSPLVYPELRGAANPFRFTLLRTPLPQVLSLPLLRKHGGCTPSRSCFNEPKASKSANFFRIRSYGQFAP